MKKLYLINNQEVFQGEKYLKKGSNYFEGWYFKNTNEKESISFIPGINIENKYKRAFIQVITNDSSYYINYDINDFEYSLNPFYVKIKNNMFSKEKITLNIKAPEANVNISGELKLYDNIEINKSMFSPNIMGPFSYIPFMECNHAILSMKNKVDGKVLINNKIIKFDKGSGYIEKDWGSSFPKSYIWGQGNCFNNKNSSFMISVADIPFKVFSFTGFICNLKVDDNEYKFTTYNGAKLLKFELDDNKKELLIELNKDNNYLKLQSKINSGSKLYAPIKGRMEKDIIESVTSKFLITLKEKDKIIFSDVSKNCGLEIVK